MNTQATMKSVQVNDGVYRDSEIPVWVGSTTIPDAINGRYVKASVTKDREWLWLRLSIKPADKVRAKLVSLGFMYSSKRDGWHATITEPVVRYLNEQGATLTYHGLLNALPPREVKPYQAINLGDLSIEECVEPPVKVVASKPKKENVKPVTTPDAIQVALLEQLIAMNKELTALRTEVNELKQGTTVQVTQPSKPIVNGKVASYGVGGINFG